jgi:TM2 domain-containing membrane protein YozV
MSDDWYYARKGERFGPVPLAKVRALAEQGWLMPADLVWNPGMPDWQPAASVKGLFTSSLVESLGSTVDGVIPRIRRLDPADDSKNRSPRGGPGSPFGGDFFDELSPRHLVAAGGGFVAALGIAFTVIAPSSLALAFTLGGLALAAAGMHVEVGRLVAQAAGNLAQAWKERAERKLEAQRLAVEKQRLDVEAARLAAEKEARERPMPPASALPPASAVPPMSPPPPVPVWPTGGASATGPRMVPAEYYGAGEHVTVINHAPVRRWSPGVAAVLSFCMPGLGQLYKGQIINGIVWFCAVGLGYAALILPGLLLHFFCIVGAASGNPWTAGRTEVVRR